LISSIWSANWSPSFSGSWMLFFNLQKFEERWLHCRLVWCLLTCFKCSICQLMLMIGCWHF
jgi:hypothetical protein